jgi:hypothetical protein
MTTEAVLWAFAENVEGAILEGTARKNLDQAMVILVDALKKLTTTPHHRPMLRLLRAI